MKNPRWIKIVALLLALSFIEPRLAFADAKEDAAQAAKDIDAAYKEAQENIPNGTVKPSEDKLDEAARKNDDTPDNDPGKQAAQKAEDDARSKADDTNAPFKANGDKRGDKYREALKKRREACKRLKKALADLRQQLQKRRQSMAADTSDLEKAIRDAEKARKEQEKTPERPTLSMAVPQGTPTLATFVASGKIKIDSTGTGETIGHVADLKIENSTDLPLTCAIPPIILESGTGKNQHYACPSGQTVALNPHQTKTVPMNGVCLNRNKPPVGKGVSGDLVINEANPTAPQNPNSHLPPADADKLLRICTSKYNAADQLQKSGAFKNLPYHDPQKQKDIVVQWSTWCDPRISQITGAPPATKDDLKKVVYKQLESKGPMPPETKKKVDQGIDTIFEKVELTTAKAKDLEQATGENVAPGTSFNVSNETPAPEPQRQEKPKEETPSPPPPHTEEKPKPVAGDPEGGIDIPGHGKAHRGTGTRDNPNNPNDKRAAFYLWMTISKDSKCKGYAWYQYVNVTVKLDDTDVTDTLAKDGKIKTAIGADLILGKWNGDYHKEDEKKQKTKPKHESMPGSNPPVDAGPYASRPIDGTPGAEGLIDAPNWGNTGAWKELVTRLANRGKIRKKRTGENQPPDSTFTLTITSNFRDYLYCIDPRACLGWSEETYVETLKFKLTWALSPDVDMDLDKTQQVWVSTVSFVSSDSKVTFGKWNACP